MHLKGYRRPDGRVGFRNHLLILPTSICSSSLAQKISRKVPGSIAIIDNSGCCILDNDQEIHARTIINTAGNPNVGATLVVDLGCEALSAERAASEIEKFGKPVRHLSIQQVGGTVKAREEGVRIAKEMMSEISILKREPVLIADLSVGLECGGSDPASGLTANPSLGVAVDRIVDEGGTAIIGETDEFIGAELLMSRNAKSRAVGKRIVEVVRRYEKYVQMFGTDLSTGQPTRGNIEAGLSTIEEKSLGCVMKLGTRPIVEVLEYAAMPSQKGPILMDTPGFDVASTTGLVAGGCQVIVFTTGRGTPLGTAITPVIKVISNTPAYERMRDNIDINAGSILEGGETIAEVGERIFKMILQVCNGQKPRAEILKEGQFAVWQTAAIL
jgi:altronate dehydratase large subunit